MPPAPNKVAREQQESMIQGVGHIDELRFYRGEKIISMAESISTKPINREYITVPLAVDVYYAFYLPVPVLNYALGEAFSDPQSRMRMAILNALLSSRKIGRVKAYTTADSITSIVAAASFIERLNRILTSEAAASGSREGEGEESPGDSAGGDRPDKLSNLEKRIDKALDEVAKDAKVAKDIKSAVAKAGAGSASMLAYSENPEDILRLARETDISKILEKIEGVKLVFEKPTKRMIKYSRGWFTGVEYGRDLERIHHSQLALPEDVFLTEFANDKLLLFEKSLPASQGPIYVLLDKSGSMIGEKIDWARAVAVALLQKAVSEGRDFYARFFDSMTYPLMKLKRRARPSSIIKVLTYLASVKAGGGTSITNAIYTASQDIKQAGRDKVSDVVLITDGEDKINLNMLYKVKMETRMRLHTVMVQGINQYLKKLSDRYLVVKKLDAQGILKVVDFEEQAREARRRRL